MTPETSTASRMAIPRTVWALGFVSLFMDLSTETVFAGVAVWGLHMGFTQGILAAMVAETAPGSLRGTAFGVFSLASGICMLFASLIAGWLWDHHGASTTFFTGAALAVVPLIMCGLAPRPQKNGR